jgi:actin related protein 2/3 complex subunit 1A/1B
MSSAPKRFTEAVAFHSFNKDGSKVAICDNDAGVEIWDTSSGEDNSKWKREHRFTEHGGFVSCVDWSPVTNEVVTCGHDRNAYVWKLEGKEWKPTLVILRINRGATSVRWSPSGKKFAVSSGAKCVPVCHYEESNHWWISKMIKKHKSTVLSVAWSPNSKFVVTGSCDKICRIFSAYIEGVDEPSDSGFGWKKEDEFGAPLATFDQAKAWVNSVAWSPNGNTIAFAGHGSTLSFVDLASKGVTHLDCQTLPFLDIKFQSDTSLIGAGFDMNPIVFTGPEWKQSKKLDDEKGVVKKSASSAMAKFKAADSRGKKFGDTSKTVLKTKHQNTITSIQFVKGGLTTSGLDGRILFWKL